MFDESGLVGAAGQQPGGDNVSSLSAARRVRFGCVCLVVVGACLSSGGQSVTNDWTNGIPAESFYFLVTLTNADLIGRDWIALDPANWAFRRFPARLDPVEYGMLPDPYPTGVGDPYWRTYSVVAGSLNYGYVWSTNGGLHVYNLADRFLMGRIAGGGVHGPIDGDLDADYLWNKYTTYTNGQAWFDPGQFLREHWRASVSDAGVLAAYGIARETTNRLTYEKIEGQGYRANSATGRTVTKTEIWEDEYGWHTNISAVSSGRFVVSSGPGCVKVSRVVNVNYKLKIGRAP